MTIKDAGHTSQVERKSEDEDASTSTQNFSPDIISKIDAQKSAAIVSIEKEMHSDKVFPAATPNSTGNKEPVGKTSSDEEVQTGDCTQNLTAKDEFEFKMRFSCEFCAFETGSVDNIVNHLEVHSKTNKPYVCKLCETRFKIYEYLRLHTVKEHEEQPKHLCETCDKKFFTKQKLNAHQAIHSRDTLSRMYAECKWQP